jgi:hypothetical protein
MADTNGPLPIGHRPAEQRVGQDCDACRQVDTDPRHHLRDVVDGQVVDVSRHMDCCAAAGCADCAAVLDKHGNARGDKLVAALTKGR